MENSEENKIIDAFWHIVDTAKNCNRIVNHSSSNIRVMENDGKYTFVGGLTLEFRRFWRTTRPQTFWKKKKEELHSEYYLEFNINLSIGNKIVNFYLRIKDTHERFDELLNRFKEKTAELDSIVNKAREDALNNVIESCGCKSNIHGSFDIDADGKLNFVCNNTNATFDEVKTALTKLKEEVERQLANEDKCPFNLNKTKKDE